MRQIEGAPVKVSEMTGRVIPIPRARDRGLDVREDGRGQCHRGDGRGYG
jgi:hypothetical protein